MVSINFAGPGPIAQTVLVPATTWVLPASLMLSAGRPAERAFCINSINSVSESIFKVTLG